MEFACISCCCFWCVLVSVAIWKWNRNRINLVQFKCQYENLSLLWLWLWLDDDDVCCWWWKSCIKLRERVLSSCVFGATCCFSCSAPTPLWVVSRYKISYSTQLPYSAVKAPGFVPTLTVNFSVYNHRSPRRRPPFEWSELQHHSLVREARAVMSSVAVSQVTHVAKPPTYTGEYIYIYISEYIFFIVLLILYTQINKTVKICAYIYIYNFMYIY